MDTEINDLLEEHDIVTFTDIANELQVHVNKGNFDKPSMSEAKPRKMDFAQIWWRGVFLGVVFEFLIKKPL